MFTPRGLFAAKLIKERDAYIAKRNKDAQMEIAQGISKVIQDVFNCNGSQDAFLSEAQMTEQLSTKWRDHIHLYLLGLSGYQYDVSKLSVEDLVPTIDNIDTTQREGVVKVDPSDLHKRLAIGNDDINVLSRARLMAYGCGIETIYEETRPLEDGPQSGETIMDVGDSNSSFVDKDLFDTSRFAVRGGRYGVVDQNGDFKELATLESIAGVVRKKDTDTTSDKCLVTWYWATTHPHELRPGMIAYPEGMALGPDAKVSMYQGNGEWIDIPYLTE